MNLGKTHFQRQKCHWITFKGGSKISDYMTTIKKLKVNGYFREGSYVSEIFTDGRRVLFPRMAFSRNCFWIYNSVIKDVAEYLKTNKPKRTKRYPSIFWNKSMTEYSGKITATDINYAYWRIAYLRGYICEQTYLRGLEIKDKSMRNSSLSNLNSEKQWYIIKNGNLTERSFIVSKPDNYKNIYNDIRFFCYKLMNDLSLRLGNDFICYKVDCIYYVDTKANRKLVQGFLNENEMEWKQLEEKYKKTIKNKKNEKNNVSHGGNSNRSRNLRTKEGKSN